MTCMDGEPVASFCFDNTGVRALTAFSMSWQSINQRLRCAEYMSSANVCGWIELFILWWSVLSRIAVDRIEQLEAFDRIKAFCKDICWAQCRGNIIRVTSAELSTSSEIVWSFSGKIKMMWRFHWIFLHRPQTTAVTLNECNELDASFSLISAGHTHRMATFSFTHFMLAISPYIINRFVELHSMIGVFHWKSHENIQKQKPYDFRSMTFYLISKLFVEFHLTN